MMVALVTPFTEDGAAVDYDKLAELIEWHVAQKTDGLIMVGTTGESPTLSHEEHHEVIRVAVETAKGRMPIVAGTGSNSTAEALSLTRAAEKAGADGSLQVTPYYNKPTQEGLYRHFKTVAEAVDIPIMLYNIPTRVITNIAVDTVKRLAEIKNIVAVKEASGSLDQASAIVTETDLAVLSGDDSLTLPLMAVGGQGVVSVVGNIVPADMKAMVEAALSGDYAAATARHKKLFPLCRAMFIETNPISVKTAMKLLGRVNGALRLPMSPMAEENVAKLKAALEAYGVT
jgi:4-hydroxy-tetrahydrodipicolinate synthase